jgi:hypothetical protein
MMQTAIMEPPVHVTRYIYIIQTRGIYIIQKM